MTASVLLCFLLSTFLTESLGERAPTWDSCNCRWGSWSSWTECSETCGGGRRQRDRKVWHDDRPACDGFEKCATSGSGWERQLCNSRCFNGASFKHYSWTSTSGYCDCKKGTKGRCCKDIVTCGQPSSISNGRYTGSDFTYSHEIKYACNTDYNMTSTSHAVLRCTEHGSWSSSAPECIYAASCKSSPCKNSATCTNLLGGYRCTCQNGWTGKNCETDIQPPIVGNCSDNREVFTTDMTYELNWEEPVFHDPMGNEVQVTKNYRNSVYTFPWGTFTVQYNAVKPSNGLTNECTFNVTIKPNPCKPLVAPENGFVVCNNWMNDYATICKMDCKKGYIFSPAYKREDWYNCGATGTWIPSSAPSECVEELLSLNKDELNQDSKQLTDCTNETDTESVKSLYIEELLESNLNSLCLDYRPLCNWKNVMVVC